MFTTVTDAYLLITTKQHSRTHTFTQTVNTYNKTHKRIITRTVSLPHTILDAVDISVTYAFTNN